MSQKFFSFIHGQSVHIAPNTKVIKQKELSTLCNAKNLLQKAKEDAKEFKKEMTQEFEQERILATKEGFEEGFSKWVDKVKELEEEITKVREETEKVIVSVALSAAKKILGRELETSKTAVVDIVKNALKNVSQHKKITIWVNKNDYQLLDKERDSLKSVFEKLEALSIRPRDDIESGGCVIETEAGIINAKLENQWLILQAAFEKMMPKQQGSK
jgi:type III secretion protein L